MTAALALRVASVRALAPAIREFRLEAANGSALPAFSPGSHLVLELPAGDTPRRNAYSLTSSPFDRSHYRIAVRLQPDSRGGSRFLHGDVDAGRLIAAYPPANYFHFEQGAGKWVLIAGGIGVTPFMSLLPCLQQHPADVEMHYAYRSEADAAYIAELQAAFGDRLHRYEGARGQRLAVGSLLDRQAMGTRVYVCGPPRLIEAVRREAAERGWPDSAVRFEKFAADDGGTPFRVRLARSDVSVSVGEAESLLEALEKQGVDVPNLCRAGVCGECRTPLLQGAVDHRDLFLSEAEKQTGDCIMPCVSRACGDAELVLDL